MRKKHNEHQYFFVVFEYIGQCQESHSHTDVQTSAH